jgi:GTP-binding protein
MIEGFVAIVGRPNVGKSTLFNCLTRSRDALVNDLPGLTRDRLYGVVERNDDEEKKFMVIDTGGFETEDYKFQPFGQNIVWEQTKIAIEEADLVVFLLDGKEGLHPHDSTLVQYLRQQKKEVVYAINKIDGLEQTYLTYEFYKLGVTEFMPITAAHNRGVVDLKDEVARRLDAIPRLKHAKGKDDDAIHVALIGRPNAGKSSLLNRLVGQERSLVSEVAGTTRDAMDTPFNYNLKPYVLIDTAGIRRKSKIKEKIESLSVLKSIQAIQRSDIVVLVIDAIEGFVEQDARLTSWAIAQYKPVLIVVNKWDLFPNKTTHTAKEYTQAIYNEMQMASFVPVIYVSCLENQRVPRIMEQVEILAGSYRKRVGTSAINAAMKKIVHEHTPALIRNHSKLVKFYYATQVKASPPTIVVKCNLSEEIQESYKRYMQNRFREELGFGHIPLHLLFRGKSDLMPVKPGDPDYGKTEAQLEAELD